MLYTGIDLIEVNRIARSAEKWGAKFAGYIFTPDEIEYCKGRPAELAARYAAKEAAGKALGTGIGWGAKVWWVDVEVISDQYGRPSLKLHRGAAARAEKLGWTEVSLSLSHTRELAIALVVARGG
jgi:holo-[acyl-carrier protein] synthase